jgi:hypothetical protein
MILYGFLVLSLLGCVLMLVTGQLSESPPLTWPIVIGVYAGMAAMAFACGRISEAIDTSMSRDSERHLEQEKSSTGVSDAGALQDFALLRKRNGVIYSVNSACDLPTSHREGPPRLRIETTQLFTNPNCGLTHLNKQWRARTFSSNELGSIDVSLDRGVVLFLGDHDDGVILTATAPWSVISDGDTSSPTVERIRSVIAEGDGVIAIHCDESGSHIEACLGPRTPAKVTDQWLFSAIQLFALEVHRIFGSFAATRG